MCEMQITGVLWLELPNLTPDQALQAQSMVWERYHLIDAILRATCEHEHGVLHESLDMT